MPEQARSAPLDESSKVVLTSAELTSDQTFRLLTGSIVPRPIAWTSTISKDGVPNLAPFSFFTVVSTQPPMVSLTVENRADGSCKDTLLNIRETGEFVVNIVSATSAHKVFESSRDLAPEVDEFRWSSADAAPSLRVRAPSVKESLINLECVLHDVLRPGSDAVVIGEVIAFGAHPTVLGSDGHIDVVRLSPLARMAAQFARVGAPFHAFGDIAPRGSR